LDDEIMSTITPVRVASFAMRTRFEILLWDERRSDADLRAAGEEALRAIAEAETRLSAYRPDAALYQLNERLRDASGSADVPGWLGHFLRYAMLLSEQTGGAFDPTLGDRDAVFFSPLLSEGDLSLQATQSVTTSRPGVRFDPGAIGKGYGLDRAKEVLQEAGIRNALLHGGTSSVVAMGGEPGGGTWRVAIASPEKDEPPLATWHLQDGDTLGVSANYERATHILDPRTKKPIPEKRLTAVLVPLQATLADALSTALLVVGEAGQDQLRESFPEVREWFLLQKEYDHVNTKP
jgi:thiamine biosynthesis lipoprotein